MPRYFFNLHIDQNIEEDDTGTEIENIEDVRSEAQKLLPAVSFEELPKDGDHRSFVVLVTDEAGRPVYSASLNYTGLWLRR